MSNCDGETAVGGIVVIAGNYPQLRRQYAPNGRVATLGVDPHSKYGGRTGFVEAHDDHEAAIRLVLAVGSLAIGVWADSGR